MPYCIKIAAYGGQHHTGVDGGILAAMRTRLATGSSAYARANRRTLLAKLNPERQTPGSMRIKWRAIGVRHGLGATLTKVKNLAKGVNDKVDLPIIQESGWHTRRQASTGLSITLRGIFIADIDWRGLNIGLEENTRFRIWCSLEVENAIDLKNKIGMYWVSKGNTREKYRQTRFAMDMRR